MRGTAAVAVVVFHAPAFFAPLALPSGYLAVDLFFALSGFVIDYAYRARLDAGMGVLAFMRTRLIRLYPLYLLGLLIGGFSALAALKLGGGSLDAKGLATATATGLLILPSPTASQAPQLFPLNSPAWSLFFELLVNLVFAALWKRLSLGGALTIAGASGLALAALCLGAGEMGLGDTWASFGFGFLRAMTSFFLGVALHRIFAARGARRARGRGGAILPFLILPLFALAPQGEARLAYELGFIFLAAPALVWFCARAAPGPRLGGLYRGLGAASYAVYVLHYPLVELTRRALHVLGREPAAFAPWLGATFLAAVLTAALVLDNLYDLRARRFLAARLSPPRSPSR